MTLPIKLPPREKKIQTLPCIPPNCMCVDRIILLSNSRWRISFSPSACLPTLIIKKIQTSVWTFTLGTVSRWNQCFWEDLSQGGGAAWYGAISRPSKQMKLGGCAVNSAWTWNFNQNLMVVIERKKKKGMNEAWTTCRKFIRVCVCVCAVVKDLFIVHVGTQSNLCVWMLEDHLRAQSV